MKKNNVQLLDEIGQLKVRIAELEINKTVQKRNEEELARFTNIIEELIECVSITDKDNKFIFVNSAFENNYGYSIEDLYGKTSNILVVEDSNDDTVLQNEIFKKTKLGGWKGELLNRKKDGTIFPVELSITPLKNADGKIIAYFRISANITERKKYEKDIQKEAFQRGKLLDITHELNSSLDYKFIIYKVTKHSVELLNSKGATIYLLDSDKKVLEPVATYDSPHKAQVMSDKIIVKTSLSGQVVKSKKGMIFNNASQMPMANEIPSTSKDEHLMVLPLLVENEIMGTLTVYRRAKVYEKKDVELAEIFALYAGTAIRNAHVHQDLMREIKERKLSVIALKDSEERFHRFANASYEGIGITVKGILKDVNNQLVQMTGYSKGELIGAPLKKLIYPDDQMLVGIRIKSGYADPYEFRILRKDGSTIHVEARETNTTYKGEDARLVCVYDTTGRKEGEGDTSK